MNRPPKLLLVLAAALLLVLAGFLWLRLHTDRTEAERKFVAIMRSRELFAYETREAAARLTAAQRREADAAQALAQLRAAKPRPADASPPPLRTMTDIISKDPRVEVLMLRWQREVSALEFGPFFRMRGITPGQIKRFQDAWVKEEEQVIDLKAAGRLENADPAAIKRLEAEAQAEYDATLAEVFGPETYRDYLEFRRTLPVRNVVVLGFAGAAALEGVPITAEQGERLFQAALASTGVDSPPPGSSADQTERLLTRIGWDRVDAVARQILTPAQYALFTTNAAPSGFDSRHESQFKNAVRLAHEADVARGAAGAARKPRL
jgi:hypothetical protein